MQTRMYLSRVELAAVSTMELLDIRLHGEPLFFAYDKRGRALIGGRWFLAHDYQELDWLGGMYGGGWIALEMSPHAAANLLMHLRKAGWQAENLPPDLLEKWEYGTIWNTDLMVR